MKLDKENSKSGLKWTDMEKFKIFPDNELFHSDNLLRGNIYKHDGYYYFKPDPNGSCIWDLRDSLNTSDI